MTLIHGQCPRASLRSARIWLRPNQADKQTEIFSQTSLAKMSPRLCCGKALDTIRDLIPGPETERRDT